MNTDNETAQKILHEDFKIKSLWQDDPYVLIPEQKEHHKEICTDMLQQLDADPNLFQKITCDEIWIFQFDPETKWQSVDWKTPSSSRMKKLIKASLDSKNASLNSISCSWVKGQGFNVGRMGSNGITVNQHYYKDVLTKSRKRIRKMTRTVENGSTILHQESAPAHTALTVKQFLANKYITILEHPPYSTDLAPCFISIPQGEICT